jgi:glucan 1,3-beta-glucosidase
MHKKQYPSWSVNLGGWFIPEIWLTHAIFRGTDAKDLASLLRTEEGKRRYERHLETFITEDDFKWLDKHDIRLVRLPVGYWALKNDDTYPATTERLDWAMAMAEKYHIDVLLDLHAVRGSQNGQSHSGSVGTPMWHKSPAYQEETIRTLLALARRYSTNSALWGVELINEPTIGRYYFTLLRFYRRAYKRLRSILPHGTYIVFPDAFHPLLFAGALRPARSHPVAIDVHWYAYNPGISGRYDVKLYMRLRHWWQTMVLTILSFWQPVIIGEWSGVLPLRALRGMSVEEKHAVENEHVYLQRQTHRRAIASIYWTYKGEGPGIWDFRSLVEDGRIVLK